MKLCDKHREEFLNLLKENGFTPYIGKDKEEAKEIMRKHQEDNTKAPDPMIKGQAFIMAAMIECGDISVLIPDICPICNTMEEAKNAIPELEKQFPEEVENAKNIDKLMFSDTVNTLKGYFAKNNWPLEPQTKTE